MVFWDAFIREIGVLLGLGGWTAAVRPKSDLELEREVER